MSLKLQSHAVGLSVSHDFGFLPFKCEPPPQRVTRGDISIISIILVTAVTTGAVGGGVLFSSWCTF